MFKSARLKLTVLYLVFIMIVSGFFSLAIYRFVSVEIETSFRQIEAHLRVNRPLLLPPKGQTPTFQEEINSAKGSVAKRLFYINAVIALVSATFAYYMSGRTLKPIETAYGEQKRFLADASHELKTPLTSLKVSIEVALRDKKLTLKKAKKIMSESLVDVDQMQNLTQGLLTLARLEKFDTQIECEEIEIKSMIGDVIGKLSPLSNEKKIKVTLQSKKARIRADKSQVEKLVTILLDNAIKYTPKGGKINIKTGVGKKNISITVKDTGIGIDEDDLPKIFDLFYRADQSRTKQKTPGHGLGLSMAKRIVDLHGGSIHVHSQIDKGTTFTVSLPKA